MYTERPARGVIFPALATEAYLDFAACRRGPAFLVSVQVFWEQRPDEVADGGHKLYEQT